jgi:hypothetical protein
LAQGAEHCRRRHLSRNESLRANSFARTKESVREIRHVYLDLDEDAPASLRSIQTDGNAPVPNFVLDTSPEKNQVVWRVDSLDREQAEVFNFKETSRPPTLRVFCACLDSPTASKTRHLSCAQSNSQMRFTSCTISRFTKIRSRRPLHEARTGVSMLLGLIFLLIVDGGTWSLDATLFAKRDQKNEEA